MIVAVKLNFVVTTTTRRHFYAYSMKQAKKLLLELNCAEFVNLSEQSTLTCEDTGEEERW